MSNIMWTQSKEYCAVQFRTGYMLLLYKHILFCNWNKYKNVIHGLSNHGGLLLGQRRWPNNKPSSVQCYLCWKWYTAASFEKVSIVGSLRDREVACSASDRQGSNFESCVWRTVSSQSSHHPQEVLLAQFSLYVHKGGLKPDSFHFHFAASFELNKIIIAAIISK